MRRIIRSVCAMCAFSLTRRALEVALAVFVTIFCVAGLAHAQATNSGDIRGVVTDTSGGVVPAATVTVLNVNTGVTKVLTTNSAGVYDTVSILPGQYTVTVSKQGFQTYVRSNLIVEVGTPLAVDATLSVGATTQTIQVTSQSPLLKTENATQEKTLTSNVMTELPNVTQSWVNFLQLIPGTTTPTDGINYEVQSNGTLPGYNNLLQDGVAILVPHSSNMDAPADFGSVSELQVSTTNFSAQYGNGGNMMNVITKSGTNQYHGELYDYEQNTALNARSFFQKGVGVTHFHQFGGTFGGPIKKDKAFFFVSVDKIINVSNGSGYHTVPTLDERNGNFSETDPSGTALFPTIYYPTYSSMAGTPIPGNNLQNTTLTMDTVAQAVQQYIPAPNQFYSNGNPLVHNNYLTNLNYTSPQLWIFGRVDYNLTDNNRLSITSQRHTSPNNNPSIFGALSDFTHFDIDYVSQITDVWTLSPTLVNEARLGYMFSASDEDPDSLGQGYPQKIGLQYAKVDMFPGVSIGGPVGSFGISAGTAATYHGSNWNPSDTLTMIRGRHILHFGGELLYFVDNDSAWGNLNPGAFSFRGVYTAPNTTSTSTGLGYADFLLGAVSSWNAGVSPVNGMRQAMPQFFFQDDFKVTPHLTLNLGVRYQIQTGWREKHNQLGAFDPNVVNPVSGVAPGTDVTIPAGTLGAMWFAPQDNRSTLQQTKWNIFLPRLGFAWNFKPSWVVRGGFGVYSYIWSEDMYGGGEGNGASSSGNATDTSNASPVAAFEGTGASLPFIVASRQPVDYIGQGLTYNPYDTAVGKSYQYSLAVEKEFAHNMVASLKYIGNHTNGLGWPVDINQVPENLLAGEATQDSSLWQLNRPYPLYEGLGGNVTYLSASSNYNSLQGEWTKRFSSGLTFGTSFTWGKMLDEQDSAGWTWQAGAHVYQNAYDPAANYGEADADRNWMTSGYVVYQLPVGHGKRFLDTGGPADWVLGGWQMSSMYYWESGDHITPLMSGSNGSESLAGNWYPDVVGSYQVANPSLSEWFNPAAFASPAEFTFGNMQRNLLVGPSRSRIDFALAKNFAIPQLGEAGHLQIRMDSTNIINHPSFADPNANIGATLAQSIANGAGTISGTSVGGRTIQLGARLVF
jgi:Carboxypeptidase regulatory-like domain